MASAVQLLGEVRRLVDGIDSRQLTHVDDTGYRRDLDRFVSTVRAKLLGDVQRRRGGIVREVPSAARRWSVRSTVARPFDEAPVNPAGPT